MTIPAPPAPVPFDGSFSELKERQLVFQLTRQLAQAQFARGDHARSERLWQEAAAGEMDPARIIALLYGVADHDDTAAMEEVDRNWRARQREQRRPRWALGLRRGLVRRRGGTAHPGRPARVMA
jgi:hypothetical protein